MSLQEVEGLAVEGVFYWLAAVALWLPVTMFQRLRGGCGSSIIGSLAWTLVIWTITVTAFLMLLTWLMVWALGRL